MMENLQKMIKNLEDLTIPLVGKAELHEARFKIFEAINILIKFKDDQRLIVRCPRGGRS